MSRDCVLVVNAGSSSLKFTVYRNLSVDTGELATKGQIESIGTSPHFIAYDDAGGKLADEKLDATDGIHGVVNALASWLRSRFSGTRVLGVGHRVVHGGAHYSRPTVITSQVMHDLRMLVPLAPLHQPHNIALIDAVADRMPNVPQVACFDTSFHRGQPAVAELVPLPAEIRECGVQRYGFHGLSYEYIASVLPRVAPAIAGGNVIVAHLGSGASMCALKNRRSIDCTLGFTPLDGLCMGTRPGSIDPGVVLHLFQGLNLTAGAVETLLYKKSGLLGISGISNDMRHLLASDQPSARLALDYFVYRATKEIGALTAVLGGLDALIFTAGIGEKSVSIRKRICDTSAWLGIELDEARNTAGGPCISAPGSDVSAWMIPTNEELMIARHTGSVLGLF